LKTRFSAALQIAHLNITRGCGRWGAACYGAVLGVEYCVLFWSAARDRRTERPMPWKRGHLVQGGEGFLWHLLNMKLIGQPAAKLLGFFANYAVSRRDLDLWPFDLKIGPQGARVPGTVSQGPILPSLVFVGLFVFPLGGGTGQTARRQSDRLLSIHDGASFSERRPHKKLPLLHC